MAERIGAIELPIHRLHMELTNICNFSCEFCPDALIKRQRGMMSVDMAQSILDELGHSPIVKTVHFHVMGEPTLHPHLFEIADYAQGKKVDVCLTTNGSQLTREVLMAAKDAGIRQLIISLQTPDEETFSMRGSSAISFDDYADQIISTVQTALHEGTATKIVISFLSSPLRRLIIPIAKEFKIADTSKDLRRYMTQWAELILRGTPFEHRLPSVMRQMKGVRSFRENTVTIADNLSFHTRIVGDWAKGGDGRIVKARFGYCPGITENFGILWNGDYVFCCTDYDGRTSTGNRRDLSIADYLRTREVQEAVRGFQRFRVVHPYCQTCIGDRSYLNTLVKQIGSILYFKWLKGSKGKS